MTPTEVILIIIAFILQFWAGYTIGFDKGRRGRKIIFNNRQEREKRIHDLVEKLNELK